MSRLSATGKQISERDIHSKRLEYSTDSVSSLLMQDTHSSDNERIIEESPNRRYAKVLYILHR
jgi:hypothetical protein